MIPFPVKDLLSERKCCRFLLKALHPDGLKCPCGAPLEQGRAPHDRKRAPVFKYKCPVCGKTFNMFTGTVWKGTHPGCATIVLIIRGIAQGVPTARLAAELELDYGSLLERRHRIQDNALLNRADTPLPDKTTEADEMFRNAGEKGSKHSNPGDPPRRRANKRKGRGTMENDRPPVAGIVGRESGQIRLRVTEDTRQATMMPLTENGTAPDTHLNTDESPAYAGTSGTGRKHSHVCHSAGERARDDDGDGIREVHCNTMEGIWTGPRNFLRPFRGIRKAGLKFYVAVFELGYNAKQASYNFLRALMIPGYTYLPT